MGWTIPDLVSVIENDHNSNSLVAAKKIPANTLIGIYEGKVISVPIKADGKFDLAGTGFQHKDLVQLVKIKNTVLCLADSDFSGIDFINHSCHANCRVENKTMIYSSQAISKNEDLTIDYRKMDFVPEGIECWCTSRKCHI